MFFHFNFILSTVLLPLLIIVLASGNGYTSEINPERQSDTSTHDEVVQDSEDIKKATAIINQYINREGEQILLDIINNERPGKNKALFLLGRFYMEEKSFDKAGHYLQKAYEAYPLLSDYALKLLLDVYVATERHEKVIETAPLIKNRLLIKNAQKAMGQSIRIIQGDGFFINSTARVIDCWGDLVVLKKMS